MALEWVRRGKVYLHVEKRGRLRIRIEPTHGPADYAYLFGPDGRTIVRRRLDHRYRGALERELAPGLYTLVPSPSHRFRVELDGGEISFEPETEFPSLFQGRDGTPLYFQVSEGCSAFTIAATNQHDWTGSAARVRLYRPGGALETTLEFDDLDAARVLAKLGVSPEQAARYAAQGDTAIVPELRLLITRHRVADPTPGVWRVEAEVQGPKADDIGFWLEGIPNRFAAAGTRDALAALAGGVGSTLGEAVAARVRIDPGRVLGPCGDVGVDWGWTTAQETARAVFETLGLSADTHFFPQSDMEPENDDADPDHLDPDRFLFGRFVNRMEPYRRQWIPLTSLMVISRIAPWARQSLPEIAEYAEACVRYHQVEEGLSRDRLYWQFLNEPNHDVSPGEYVAGFRAVGDRLRDRLEAAGVPVRFGGPATGNAWQETDAVPWEWIEGLLSAADDVLDFVVWNQYRLGRIEDTWRFRDHIMKADSLIAALDSDGRREEILIGATNLRGGIVLQNDRQDGAYSALWWPSVLCNALGTGRCRLINYFFLIDQGARRKGLLFEDWRPKPVAEATAFFTDFCRDSVVASTTDHDGLDVLATASGSEMAVLLVNRTERTIDAEIALPSPELPAREAARKWALNAEAFDPAAAARRPSAAMEIDPASTTSQPILLRLAAQSLLGVRLHRSD
jgi:hypothetical protein